MPLPTVADLRPHINSTSTADDEELANHLDAAVEMVAGIVGPIDAPAAVTETHRDVSSDVLILRRMPVVSLTAVSSRVGATSTALTLADYELDAASGLVRAVDGSRFYGTFVVSYTSGREALPASIRLAILIIAAHLWETQRGSSPSPLSLQQQEFEQTAPVGVGYAIPSRARELLAAYVSPSVA